MTPRLLIQSCSVVLLPDPRFYQPEFYQPECGTKIQERSWVGSLPHPLVANAPSVEGQLKRTVILEETLDTMARTDATTWSDTLSSAVSWASIAAGAVVTAALTLALLALGAGLGLSSVSPWTNSGVSASTFNAAAGVYLVIVAVMSSAMGGFLAARLRTRWTGIHTNEVFFRDTAHGFVAWAFATVLSASALAAAAAHIVSGAAGGATTTATRAVDPSQVYVDRLFRAEPAPAPAASTAQTPNASQNNVRAEVTRLWTTSVGTGNDLAPADRTYVARLVAAQTGLSQPDAERRVNEVVTQAKDAADQARRAAAKLAFWLTAALVFGAFAASLAAVEGGQYRDGTWQERRLTPRAWS